MMGTGFILFNIIGVFPIWIYKPRLDHAPERNCQLDIIMGMIYKIIDYNNVKCDV